MTNYNELQKKIIELKKEKDALVLAHYYVPMQVQDVADHVCDSFAMAKLARDAKEKIVVICGVKFMGESAKILAPDKTILLPEPEAGCPMADMVTVEDIARLKEEHPDAAVMCYVNSSAEVKAVSDICCTSSSAERIATKLEEEEIIFVPDSNLGYMLSEVVPYKAFFMHDGCCPIHNSVTEEDIIKVQEEHPNAVFAVHPECAFEVAGRGDCVGSTSEIIEFAHETDAEEIIIGTECEIVERLKRELPNKKIYGVTDTFVCTDMKKVTLEALYECLLDEKYEVTVPEDTAQGARKSLERMINA